MHNVHHLGVRENYVLGQMESKISIQQANVCNLTTEA